MAKKNKSYWEKRQIENYLRQEKSMQEFYDNLVKKLQFTKRSVEKEINDFYVRYAIANDINSLKIAMQKLNKAELGELEDFIATVRQYMGEYSLDVENMSIKARTTRLQALQLRIDALLQEAYAISFEIAGKEVLKQIYSDSFYRTMYNLEVNRGIHQAFSGVNIRAVEQLIEYPFNGANFSSRLWRHKDHLKQQLDDALTQALIQGKNPKVLSKEFASKFGQKEKDAYRLIQTEASYITEQAAQKAYEEDGVKEYQWLAALDLRTCPLCRPLDNERFEVGKGIVGKTLPPRHPRCRCTTIPYDRGDIDPEFDTRLARLSEKEKSFEVPASMSYKEWYDNYVAGTEYELEEMKIKNAFADKKQYDRYKESLGAEYVPKSFREFQNIKYNNDKGYEILKAQAKGMTYYNKAVANEPDITKTVKDISKTCGMDVLGIDFRIKSKESYLRKIATNYSPEGNEYEINDILRYTYGASVESLADKTIQSIDMYKDMGYNTIKVKNSWLNKDNPYNGINTIIQSPNGQRFELQYHTQESFDLKNGELHRLYEKQRVIEDKDSDEYNELSDRMFELSDKLSVPDHIERVK